MRRHRSLMVGAAALALLATAFFVVPAADALCGDCVFLYDRPECVSPPATYAFCRYYYEVELHMIAGKIIRVRVQRCEGYQPCAV